MCFPCILKVESITLALDHYDVLFPLVDMLFVSVAAFNAHIFVPYFLSFDYSVWLISSRNRRSN